VVNTHSSSPFHSPQDTHQRIAIYARVSTLHNQNPEMQLAELREYASRRGWEVTAEYVDGDEGQRICRRDDRAHRDHR
jgi:predicted site-specific integrase-resolvase